MNSPLTLAKLLKISPALRSQLAIFLYFSLLLQNAALCLGLINAPDGKTFLASVYTISTRWHYSSHHSIVVTVEILVHYRSFT